MIRATLIGQQTLRHQLQILALPPAKRRRVLLLLARQVRDTSKKRITAQVDLQGSRFTPRRRKRAARQKMLRGLKKGLAITANQDSAVVSYQNALAGRIAYAQQHGLDEVVTAAAMAARERKNRKTDTKSATRIQARALLKEGFVIREPGRFEKHDGQRVYVPGVRKSANVDWIVENIGRNQAGAILRSLRGHKGLSSWVLPGTARSFLGVGAGDIDTMLDSIFQTIKTA